MKKVKLAISTCPNDTFAFHAILEKQVDMRGLEFEIELLDISQLNQGLIAGQFDIAKGSFHLAARLSDELVVLPSGSALGFGVGPLLLTHSNAASPENDTFETPTVTLCPGEFTTATMLYRIFYSDVIESGANLIKHDVFSEIMPGIKNKTAHFGVCIHEGRFTWREQNLFKVCDLGTRWEDETGSPLPLGGIFARRSVAPTTTKAVQAVIHDSIQWGLQNRQSTLATMKKYAQEFSDEVLFSHVDLYVNQWTLELGNEGRQALAVLSQKARECGLIDTNASDIRVANSI